MIAGGVLLFASLLYLAGLFAIAWWGDRQPPYAADSRWRPRIYGLTLAVYCSSWTFYGAVGSAAQDFWSFLPIYLGPLLLLLFAPGLLRRLVGLARARSITSIGDLIGSRFGKSSALAALVTLIALIAALPYLALQLRAVAMSIDVLSAAADTGQRGWLDDSALYVGLLLALFAIGFGTRQVDAREHHRGLMLAIAVESVVKLAAFVAVGLFALGWLDRQGWPNLPASATQWPAGFAAHTLLAMLALFCLPRQFQVTVVECGDPADLEPARRWFALYLLLISLLVIPVVLAGQQAFAGSAGNPDSWILQLPMHEGQAALSLLVYLGGFSAATGMVIVASVALATMVSNHWVVPALLRLGRLQDGHGLARLVLWVRRASILALIGGAFVYHRLSSGAPALASIGLIAFAAVAQFAPAIVAGLYWRDVSRRGVVLGVLGGFLLWAYCLLLPTLLPGAWQSLGPWGISWLRPTALFGSSGWEPISHGAFWSLAVNLAALVAGSLRWRPGLDERLQAAVFLQPALPPQSGLNEDLGGRIRVADLRALTGRILGERAAERLLTDYRGADAGSEAFADRALLQYVERQLAGAIGAASARRVLTTALRGRGLDVGEVVSLLDETSQQLRFNRELLAATLDNISQGISVVDGDMRLVAWNRRYLELFEYPEGLVYIGRPVADLIRFNAERGECGPGAVDDHVARRIEHMRHGRPHVFERVRADGRVIEMRGQPMPGGGFATTFTDISDYKRSEQALIEAKETLELRVEQRTAALSAALEAQGEARREADLANLSKTRFLAAASHDLVQPLNAARLFVSALNSGNPSAAETRELAERVDASLRSAEELLDGLLEVSRLDSGALRPDVRVFAAREFCASLHSQFAAIAASRDLALRVHCGDLYLRSDRVLLRRIVQNFLANALRYTRHGGVLLAVRRHGGELRVQVWDTGPGIPAEQAQRVFEEFQRLDPPSPWGEQGLGLGLSICERMARLLGHRLRLHSTPGRGSLFEVIVPAALASDCETAVVTAGAAAGGPSSATLTVLCVDDDHANLDGMAALLQRWGVAVSLADSLEPALQSLRQTPPDLLLVDYRLGDGLDGFAVIDILRREAARELPAALVTAEQGEVIQRRARAAGYPVLGKPLRPAALRALLEAVAARKRRTSG